MDLVPNIQSMDSSTRGSFAGATISEVGSIPTALRKLTTLMRKCRIISRESTLHRLISRTQRLRKTHETACPHTATTEAPKTQPTIVTTSLPSNIYQLQ
jgi:hypothetical protein